MKKEVLNQTICLREYIYEKEYKEINELQEIFKLKDKVNLKLELEFKLDINHKSKIGIQKTNEFLYYIDGNLVSYLGISCFSGNIGEINGVTHPEWRRKGIFKELFELALDECRRRNFDEILLLSDDKSVSGIEFIKAMGGIYEVSEYRMRCVNKVLSKNINSIELRKADKTDNKEIKRQTKIYFNGRKDENPEELDLKEDDNSLVDDENLHEDTYMIEIEKQVIGKICIEYEGKSAFISGFGILPNFRGKGYGKAALIEAIRLSNENNISEVELDVECRNDTALNLYTSCGFEKQSSMNYYKYNNI